MANFNSTLLASLNPPDFPGLPAVVETPTTFEQLAAAHGFTLASLAAAVPCSVEIFRRVAQRRQPLPQDLAERLAAVLSVPVGEVHAVAGYVTAARGRALWEPRAPETVWGDEFPAIALAQTAPPTLPEVEPAPQLQAWTAGPNVALSSTPGMVRVGRNTGRIDLRTTTATAFTGPVVYDPVNAKVWTFGSSNCARFDRLSGELELEGGPACSSIAMSAVYEPTLGRIWIVDGSFLSRLNATTGQADANLTLTSGGHVFRPRDITTDGAGHLFVTGYRLTGGAPPAEGRVFKIDASTGTQLAVSTGIDLESAWGIAYDGNGFLWGTSCSSDPGGSTARIWRVPATTMIAAVETITGSPALFDPSWIGRHFGSWWVTDLTHGGPRLVNFPDNGVIAQSRLFDPLGGGRSGRVASDPWFLWFTESGSGKVHCMTPGDIEGPELVVEVGGNPDGIVVV